MELKFNPEDCVIVYSAEMAKKDADNKNTTSKLKDIFYHISETANSGKYVYFVEILSMYDKEILESVGYNVNISSGNTFKITWDA